MAVISIIGPKGGIGKTTLSINTAAALTGSLEPTSPDSRVCLVDLDIRLPAISSLLDSHPPKTFYDLFETLENKTCQVDFLRTLYQTLTCFSECLDGEIPPESDLLSKSLADYKNMNVSLFRYSELKFSDQLHELFLHRGSVRTAADLNILKPLLENFDFKEFKETLRAREENSRPVLEDYLNYIEEYGLSILGGEVPILGKKNHRKRINEPEFLVHFLDFLEDVFKRFDHVILDTPAGGVNHMSSLMNFIEQPLFVFDLSNTIAINGSIDALHSFIDYYEDFSDDFSKDRLTGLDKTFVNRLIAQRGGAAVAESLESKKFGIVFNRFQDEAEIVHSLDRLREYLEVLGKYQRYKRRIHIVGMMPYCKIINITNNRGVIFYAKDRELSRKMDLIVRNLLTENRDSPALDWSNKDILRYLHKNGQPSLTGKWAQMAGKLRLNASYGSEKTQDPQIGGVPFHRG
ncbi:MAG: ParA family protein [Nitrospinales bacterium]